MSLALDPTNIAAIVRPGQKSGENATSKTCEISDKKLRAKMPTVPNRKPMTADLEMDFIEDEEDL